VPPRAESRLARLAASLGDPLTRIGRITKAAGGIVLVGEDGRRRPLACTGYEHFARRAGPVPRRAHRPRS